MSRVNFSRLKRLEARQAKFRDWRQMSDDELNRILSEALGISVASVEELSDEDLDRLIAECRDAEDRYARAI
jgi:predicted phosphoribosyltransferase